MTTKALGRSLILASSNVLGLLVVTAAESHAQSPELSLREFASGQIKKGVRSIGFGGDGATWGNYALVWRDAGTALIDGGATSYSNGNDFTFTAVGFTSPSLWNGLVVYAIALSQSARDEHMALKSPGLGPEAVAVHGDGSNQAIFIKIAKPFAHGFSAGVLLSYEISQFRLVTDKAPTSSVDFKTNWLPSGGFGVSWQPQPRILAGVRVILNHDSERRTDPGGTKSALARSYEFRAGLSVSPWPGALIDAGTTLLDRANGLAGTEKVTPEPNLGFEQAFWHRGLVLRTGLDETTFGGGLSVKRGHLNLDVAYLHNLGRARIATTFGQQSDSVLATLTFDYGHLSRQP